MCFGIDFCGFCGMSDFTAGASAARVFVGELCRNSDGCEDCPMPSVGPVDVFVM